MGAGEPDERVTRRHGDRPGGGERGRRRRRRDGGRCRGDRHRRHRTRRRGERAGRGGRGRQPGGDGQQHEDGGHEPLGDPAGTGTTRRQLESHPPRAIGRGRGEPLSLVELRAHLGDDRHDEAHPDQPAQHGEDAHDDGQLVAQLDTSATGPGVADEDHQGDRRPHDECQQDDRRAQPAGQPRRHGGAPVVTPCSGPELDDDETVREPGRIRLSTVSETVTVTNAGSTAMTPV